MGSILIEFAIGELAQRNGRFFLISHTKGKQIHTVNNQRHRLHPSTWRTVLHPPRSTRSLVSKLLLFCSLFVSVSSQLIPQCTCNEVGPCYENIADILTQCADRCQNHFTSIGVSYPVARQCILDKLPGFSSTLDCAKSNFGQVCAAQPGPTVPKRYAETLQLAAFRELSGMLNQSGLSGTGAALTKVARKAVGCIAKCVRTRGCSGTKSCGLALPSDTQIVQTFKSCATSTGLLTTPALQSMCGCLVSAGLPQLADACPSLRVN